MINQEDWIGKKASEFGEGADLIVGTEAGLGRSQCRIRIYEGRSHIVYNAGEETHPGAPLDRYTVHHVISLGDTKLRPETFEDTEPGDVWGPEDGGVLCWRSCGDPAYVWWLSRSDPTRPWFFSSLLPSETRVHPDWVYHGNIKDMLIGGKAVKFESA